ncbi:hypothetical protein [Anaerosalibacter massiliensis]|uniref:Uncharacterized protein n=1 Tax=Anaerosalibacter massiliensis TaxID=1347392 RepID=A0A9X2MIK1_9FIRM|nr:hypothetical protein [Anaerosalibacter massiliensis]MCR2044364.1 hypothetical protein [Anaerosalibacter massiliensis]
MDIIKQGVLNTDLIKIEPKNNPPITTDQIGHRICTNEGSGNGSYKCPFLAASPCPIL